MADDKLVNQAVEAVERLCSPDKMTKEQAIDFLEDVISQLDSSLEALREETEDEESGG